MQDLLPLYHDGVVSGVTSEAVKGHLERCDVCSGEYEALSVELPQGKGDEQGAKAGFAVLVQKMKKKRRITGIIIGVLVCAVLGLLGYLFTQVPMVAISEDQYQIERAYKFEVNGEAKLFILYQSPDGDGPISSYPEINTLRNEVTLRMNQKQTVLDSLIPYKSRYDYRVFTVPKDSNQIKWGDTVIWTEEENGDDEIPEYVYEFGGFGAGNVTARGMHTEDGKVVAFEVYYEDGSRVCWDIDGNVIE